MDDGKGKKVRPDYLRGETIRVRTAQCGNFYVTTNFDEDGLYEIIVNHGKAGTCEVIHKEAICRLIGLALQYSIPSEEIVKAIIGLRCPSPYLFGEGKIKHSSCPDAIAKVIKLVAMKKGEDSEQPELKVEEDASSFEGVERSVGICPECGSPLFPAGGCAFCRSCGYEKCSG